MFVHDASEARTAYTTPCQNPLPPCQGNQRVLSYCCPACSGHIDAIRWRTACCHFLTLQHCSCSSPCGFWSICV